MNYNYNQYGFNGYPNYQGQQYPQQPNYNHQQLNQNLQNYNNYQGMQQTPIQQPRLKCEYVNVSSIEEVKAYIVDPNQCIIFNDANNKILYKKTTDGQGISKITAYQEINLEQKQPKDEYVNIIQFNTFKSEIEQKINDCVQKMQNMNSIGEK